MLKIKDNVDLKELEKFGFKQGLEGCYVYAKNGSPLYNRIKVDYYSRKLRHCFPYLMYEEDYTKIENQQIVKDLISAGLVEKVGE